jgi:chromosome segregation ATPase
MEGVVMVKRSVDKQKSDSATQRLELYEAAFHRLAEVNDRELAKLGALLEDRQQAIERLTADKGVADRELARREQALTAIGDDKAAADREVTRLTESLESLQRRYTELTGIAEDRLQAIERLTADKGVADREIVRLAESLAKVQRALGEQTALRVAAEVDANAAKATRGYRLGQALARLAFWKKG